MTRFGTLALVLSIAAIAAVLSAPAALADHGHGDGDRGRDGDERAVVVAQDADDVNDDVPAPAAPANPPAPAPAPAALANPPAGAPAPTSPSAVSIANFAFSPAAVTVAAGQSVTFTNQDSAPHTSTSTANVWDSGTIQPGGTFTLTAPQQPGTYAYICNIHPSMTGALTVQ